MYDQIKITIKYFRLKKYLIGQLQYSEAGAKSAISNIRKMCPKVRKAFLVWFTTGTLPEGDFCGINIKNLITYRKMNPVAAFLAVDWYVKEPAVAYSVLAMPMKDNGSQISDIISVDENSDNEDTSDISE